MKNLFYLGLLFLMGCTAKGIENTLPGERLLFLIHAKRADIKYHEANDSYATLRLSGVDSQVTYFTDRPERKAGRMSLEKFLHAWSEGQKSFQKVPPNAGFVFYEGKDRQYHEVTVELRKPVYDADRGHLQFNVFFLDAFKGTSALDVTLFIDSTQSIRNEASKMSNA